MKKTLGEQAKAFRESKGWNTAQMGEAVGTSRQNIESLEEHGNRIPKYIGKLAVLMDKSLDAMFVEANLAAPSLLKSRAKTGALWPFERIDQRKYESLSDADKAIVQWEMAKLIESLLGQRKTPPPPTAPSPPLSAEAGIELGNTHGRRRKPSTKRPGK